MQCILCSFQYALSYNSIANTDKNDACSFTLNILKLVYSTTANIPYKYSRTKILPVLACWSWSCRV